MVTNVTKQTCLNDYLVKIKRQRNTFFVLNLLAFAVLCAVYAFAFLVFGNFILAIDLDCNIVVLLWLTIALAISGQIWLLIMTVKNLKRYHSGIRRLNMLLFKVSFQKNMSDEEINKEIQNVMRIFEIKSNIELL